MTGRLNGRHVRVAVVGAGFAGIGAAMRLTASGERSFVVLERAGEVGGTWRDNIYPGVACDVPSHLYSFSFAPRPDWPRRYASGEQILSYLRDCASDPAIRDRLHLGTSLGEARWHEDSAHWELETSRGRMTASVLVLATGRFTEPHIPEVPGLGSFPGPVFHTARWQDADLAGRRVGVVGTGASAVQVVPELVRAGARVTVFQRSAPWVLPKEDAPYAPAEQELFRQDDGARRAHRRRIFAEMDGGFRARLSETEENAELRRRALGHLSAQVSDPRLLAALTPDYAIGCKRVVLSDSWYPALASGAAALENSAFESVDGPTATAASGRRYRLDALVFATGFEAHRPAVAGSVRGSRGKLLSEHWREGMTSYASTAVSGFPNCFLLGGPNAALGHNSALAVMEAQISHLLSALEHLPEGTVCEASRAAEHEYTRQLDARAAETVWTSGGCSSWYRDSSSGRVTLLWPGTAEEFARRYAQFDAEQFTFRKARLCLREVPVPSSAPHIAALQETGAG